MIVWITGASSGIGRATALHYLARGATVIAGARSTSKLNSLAADADSLAGKLYTFCADVTDMAALRAAYTEAMAAVGTPDIAILNAGTFVRTPAASFTSREHRQLMEINYFGVLHCLELALESMRARGRGQIAIVASVAGYRGLPGASAYGASKAALINLAESMREELRSEHIDLRLVDPGFVKTPLTDANDFSMPMLMPVDEAARALAGGLAGRRFEIVFPRLFVSLMQLLRIAPATLLFAVARRMLARADWYHLKSSEQTGLQSDGRDRQD